MGRIGALHTADPCLTAAAPAAILFTDGFESYTAAGNPLDKNVAGPNRRPMGRGIPGSARLLPMPASSALTAPTARPSLPHSGQNMIRGSAPSDLDQNWYNLAYRQNGGSPSPATSDSSGTSTTHSARAQAAPISVTMPRWDFITPPPAAPIIPAPGALTRVLRKSSACGLRRLQRQRGQPVGLRSLDRWGDDRRCRKPAWFLTSVPRSTGWHKGSITVGPALGDNTNQVDFYVDDILAFSRNSKTAFGYNVLEFNVDFGPTTGYFDDVTFSTGVPEPATMLLLAGMGIMGLRRSRRSS